MRQGFPTPWAGEPYKPWGLPPLGRIKPKHVTVEALLAGGGTVEGHFVTATTRFDYKSGEPLNTVLVVSCRLEGTRYRFLFGIGGEYYQNIAQLAAGDRVSLEKSAGDILVNRMPVKRFYRSWPELAGRYLWGRKTHPHPEVFGLIDLKAEDCKGKTLHEP